MTRSAEDDDIGAAFPVSIGLEIHVQLATRTKMFCGDVVAFGAEPNTHVCPVCLGMPGALPVPNEEAVRLGVRAALGLGCEVRERSIFARKNYFYPDLPKGYQITQHDEPLATGGALAAEDGEGARFPVRIRRVHLEEDAGRLVHDRSPRRSAIDLNRAGVPLIEIVTEPDVRSPAHARAFLGLLKRTLEYLEVSDCDMEKGSLRVDANLSIRRRGARELGTPTELKNLNSFGNLERALRHEADRQRAELRAGRPIRRETLLWDTDAGRVRRMRAKTEEHDYRYFPEPDLPPLVLPGRLLESERGALPELPQERAARLARDYGLPAYDADVLTATRALADYFEATTAAAGDAKAASNWIMTEVLGWANRTGRDVDAFPVPASELGALVALVGARTVSGTAARQVLERMAETGRSAREIIDEEGLRQVSDDDRLGAWVQSVLEAHPEEAERLRAGEEKLRGFFVGRVMKASAGKADPVRTEQILRERVG